MPLTNKMMMLAPGSLRVSSQHRTVLHRSMSSVRGGVRKALFSFALLLLLLVSSKQMMKGVRGEESPIVPADYNDDDPQHHIDR